MAVKIYQYHPEHGKCFLLRLSHKVLVKFEPETERISIFEKQGIIIQLINECKGELWKKDTLYTEVLQQYKTLVLKITPEVSLEQPGG